MAASTCGERPSSAIGDPSQWGSLAEAVEIVGRSRSAIFKLAEAGHIRTYRLPGLRARYFLPDARKLAPPAIPA